MRRSRGIRPERDKDEGGIVKSLLRFFVRHGEKFVAGALIIGAVWIAFQVKNYQPLAWQPGELERLVDITEETIRNNEITAEDKEIRVFDFAAYAEQIRKMIPLDPYRSNIEWYPVLRLAPLPRGGFEILTAQSLRAEASRTEAARRAGSTAQSAQAKQWRHPSLPEIAAGNQNIARSAPAIWVNLYGTLPVWEQWEIYNQVFGNIDLANRPEYVYYEIERAEITPNEVPIWQPVVVDSVNAGSADDQSTDAGSVDNSQASRLIPFGQPQEALQERDLLLFSDFDVEPAKTYAYRIRLHVRNPNFNLQEASVEEGVDTHSEFVRSDWSAFARVYVPDRTLVHLRSVSLADDAFFPRQIAPLSPVRGTLLLDYFDIEQGLSLPLVEKTGVLRGMLGNMSRDEANRYINRGNPGEIVAGEMIVNFPEAGLRSSVCIMDFSGGRRLQKGATREAQASPDLFVPSRALLLIPDGTMRVISP